MSLYRSPRYRFTMTASGVVAANNFLTITNPAASGLKFVLLGLRVRCNAVGAVSAMPPMILSRASAVSGGSLVTNSTGVAHFRTAGPESAAEVRTGNPTATAGQPVLSASSIESTGAGTAAASDFSDIADDDFELLEGESVLFRTASGDVDQRWLIGISWKERGL